MKQFILIGQKPESTSGLLVIQKPCDGKPVVWMDSQTWLHPIKICSEASIRALPEELRALVRRWRGRKQEIEEAHQPCWYLNIISEGLVKLFRDMILAYPEGVDIRVVIATRKAMAASSGIIKFKEYLTRLEEKVYMAMGRNRVTGCNYTIAFEDARRYKPLDFADLICNTYLTRNRSRKFSPANQERIRTLYEADYIYPVFEDATVGYIKQLMFDHQMGQAMCQICTLPRLTNVRRQQTEILEAIKGADPAELKTWFTHMSLQINQYNKLRMYPEGIRFAENYLTYFLFPLEEDEQLRRIISYWIFDTNFFLLTMHDHVGNASACSRYMTACQSTLHVIDHSWEHLDYYFRYRIREMNVMMGRFDFDGVMKTSAGLIEILSQAKSLFGLIETFDGQTAELRSELLGRVYGVRLEACINLLHRRPELYDEALHCSDHALAEFMSPADLQRQYQYRCMLMTEAGQADDALQNLLQSHQISPDDPQAFHHFLSGIYARPKHCDSFGLWHYTRVMLLFSSQKDSRAAEMYKVITSCPEFIADWHSSDIGGHPWNLVLWNIGRYLRTAGNEKACEEWLKKALAITLKQPELMTMVSFALSMCAERLLWYSQNPRGTRYQEALKTYNNVLRQFMKCDLPETMRTWFVNASDSTFLPDIVEEHLK